MSSTIRDDLAAAAETYSDDIGVANYLAETYASGAVRPGDIINWALWIDTEALRDKASGLADLLPVYRTLSDPEKPALFETAWTGTGATAFHSRWRGLCNHVSGRDDVGGLYGYLQAQTNDLERLADAFEGFQKGVTAAIEQNFAGLRDKYCNALIDVGYGASDDVGNTILTYMGTGATMGSGGNLPGILVGGLVGLLTGTLVAFSDQTGNAADAAVAQLDSAQQITDAMSGVSHDLTGTLDPGKYGEVDGVTAYEPSQSEESIEQSWV